MKIRLTIGAAEVEFEAKESTDLFRLVADVHLVLQPEDCGQCGSANVVPVVRRMHEYEFFERNCIDCNARLEYGQAKQGGLFPKRSKSPKTRGWYHYERAEPAEDEERDDDYNPFEDEVSPEPVAVPPRGARTFLEYVLPSARARAALAKNAEAAGISLADLLERANAEGIADEDSFRRFCKKYFAKVGSV